MEPQRIRPVWRARGEDSGERIAQVRSRVDLKHVTLALMEPGDHEDLVARSQEVQGVGRPGLHLEPGIGWPSDPCFGASRRDFSVDRITPTGLSWGLIARSGVGSGFISSPS